MSNKDYSLKELAIVADGQVAGDASLIISGFAPLETAVAGDISFLVKAGQVSKLDDFSGSAVIVPMDIETAPVPLIRVDDPYLASAKIHTFLLEKPFLAKGVHKQVCLGKDTTVPEQVSIAAFVSLGDRVKLGERVTIESGVVLGDDVHIGDDTTLKANVTIAEGCKIGNRVTICSGAVIGSDGFGYATDKRGFHTKRPQVGIVQIDDDVEIGANSCVDRAAYGITHIKSGTKIDNLVQIAHNVVVGENSLIVSQAGIAGSTTLGRNVVLGGQVAVIDHVTLGDGVMAAARSGIHNNQKPGAQVGGAPAIPIKQFVRAATQFGKLPGMGRDIRKLKKEMEKLTAVEK
ncbi:MAG TPA: UDP-3-O-(3-hydroxymyristoyl)glucosamine N-acyltransferase [Desulfocapsa sulfexigens]|nr:UDP-3-O-(3-hydroxymyristoyl)glucosamine N-acyltransferase [Desulfocapsa sulfexigens]